MIGPKTPKPSPRDERDAYQTVTERDPWCNRCGALSMERDHRQNRSQGGLTVPSNLQGLCRKCHHWKTVNVSAAVLEGFAVPGWARPELWPAWRASVGGWVLYFDAPENGRWWRGLTQATADMLMNPRLEGMR